MSTAIATISRDELAPALDAGTIAALDAQAPGWFERERLPGAVRARPDDLDQLERHLPDGKDTPVAVYCWSETCVASAWTAERLIALGYRDVRRYTGGKRDWIEAGHPVDGDAS